MTTAAPTRIACCAYSSNCDLDRQPISGRLRPERGAEEPFVGWLGFVDALKRLNERKEQQ